jgi:transcriptional regulator with XRE-family HTH domain
VTLPEKLAGLLQKYKLSQRKLAEKSGVNYVTINRILNDYKFRVTGETIDKIAKGLGCTKEEQDDLLHLVGRVPEEIETKLGESPKAARLFRQIAAFELDDIEELLGELEERRRMKTDPEG